MPDGLTAQWLTTQLRKRSVIADEQTIVAVERQQVGEGVGMMSELSRLVLTYDTNSQDAPRTVIAKYPSQNPTNREVAMSYNLYEREVRYFVELDPLTAAKCPVQYIAELDGDNFLLLMQDLADYRCGDQIEGATLEETTAAIDELVKLHAAFWQRVDDVDWVPHIANSYHAQNMADLIRIGWPNMVAAFGSFLPSHIVDMADRFFAAMPKLQARVDEPPVTLLHGDFRMENLLFGTELDHHPLAIIDWQGPLLGQGMVDVALMLAQSTKTAVRRAHERDLVERYVAGLAEAGVEGFTLDKAWDDYRMAILYNWCYVGVVSGTLDSSNERAFAWMSKMISRQVAATEDLELLKLLDTLT